LSVSALEKNTGKKQDIRIEASTGLSDAEVQRMKDEAKANEESDKAEKERIDKLNAADALVFQSEKQVKEFGEKMPEEVKKTIEDAIAELKEAHKTQNLEAIDAATEKVNTAWAGASEHIYKDQQSAGESPQDPTQNGSADQGGNGNEGADEDVTDVEYEEVKN
jgi:molecular chaperone DnaK